LSLWACVKRGRHLLVSVRAPESARVPTPLAAASVPRADAPSRARSLSAPRTLAYWALGEIRGVVVQRGHPQDFPPVADRKLCRRDAFSVAFYCGPILLKNRK